jgi:hypothetical protein
MTLYYIILYYIILYMHIRTERKRGTLVTYRVCRFDNRRGFAAGTAPVFWSAFLQERENTLPFYRRFHSFCAKRKLRTVWHSATHCMAQSRALCRSQEVLLDKMCAAVKDCYLLFSLEPKLFNFYLLFILMNNVCLSCCN